MIISTEKYIANIIIISEIATIFQSIISLHIDGLSYFNLLVFFSLCLLALPALKISYQDVIICFAYILILTAKSLFQGFGEYYLKSALLLLTFLCYFLLIKGTTFNHVVQACVRFREVVFFLGLLYVCSWLIWGVYRNASTVTVLLILLLGYSHIIGKICSVAIFGSVMKTQYKFWMIFSLLSIFLKKGCFRYIALFVFLFFAVLFPFLFLHLDFSWVNFSNSQASSLAERLSEVHAFSEILTNNSNYLLYGWPLGTAIETEALVYRGYMHSAYLWIIGTLGLPLFFILVYFIISKRIITAKCFFIKTFLVLSNSFTFFILTSPLCTALMFSNEKDSR